MNIIDKKKENIHKHKQKDSLTKINLHNQTDRLSHTQITTNEIHTRIHVCMTCPNTRMHTTYRKKHVYTTYRCTSTVFRIVKTCKNWRLQQWSDTWFRNLAQHRAMQWKWVTLKWIQAVTIIFQGGNYRNLPVRWTWMKKSVARKPH